MINVPSTTINQTRTNKGTDSNVFSSFQNSSSMRSMILLPASLLLQSCDQKPLSPILWFHSRVTLQLTKPKLQCPIVYEELKDSLWSEMWAAIITTPFGLKFSNVYQHWCFVWGKTQPSQEHHVCDCRLQESSVFNQGRLPKEFLPSFTCTSAEILSPLLKCAHSSPLWPVVSTRTEFIELNWPRFLVFQWKQSIWKPQTCCKLANCEQEEEVLNWTGKNEDIS